MLHYEKKKKTFLAGRSILMSKLSTNETKELSFEALYVLSNWFIKNVQLDFGLIKFNSPPNQATGIFWSCFDFKSKNYQIFRFIFHIPQVDKAVQRSFGTINLYSILLPLFKRLKCNKNNKVAYDISLLVISICVLLASFALYLSFFFVFFFYFQLSIERSKPL